MSDDTTWLKKNPTDNPLKKSLMSSLRFHVPNDMDSSISSNPDKKKNPEVFIPRMLQRTNVQMRMSRAHRFKVPELFMSKPVKKKENVLDTAMKTKKIPTVKKSFLPVRRAPEKESKNVNQIQSKNLLEPSLIPRVSNQGAPEKESKIMSQVKSKNLLGPSLIPGVSGRRTLARREIIQKMVELSKIKINQEEASSQSKIISSNNSVLRSILKTRRASLRKASLRGGSQISGTKPKVKRVLFDGFETDDATLVTQMEEDEPTAFLNFPEFQIMETSPQAAAEDSSSACESETNDLESNNPANILKLWRSCKEEVNNLHNMKNSLEDSCDLFFRKAQTFKTLYASYKEDTEKIYAQLSKLSEDLEENIKKTLEGSNFEAAGTPKPKRRSAGKKLAEKVEKIRLSDKSKAIKRNSAKKTSTALKKG